MVVSVSVMVLSACAAKPQAAKEPGLNSGRVAHVVVCWLKEPGNAEQRETLIRTSQQFVQIPGVVDVIAGVPIPSDRSVVDSSYDVAIVMIFESQQALSEYAIHPLHQQAVKEQLMPMVEKLLIYDAQEPRTVRE
jgi:hypothetical protein